MSTRSGDVLAGRYRLIDLLSETGGGRFWRARDAVLERFVALHVIAEDDPRAPGLVEAARTSASVLDPRILRVLDAEQEDGRCFVVNEWGTGISLDILVNDAGPLGPRRAAWLVSDVAAAIARAHAVGVTHGRLNPENILIDRYGSIRIIGMCVDAALHGLPVGDVDGDLQDLGGLLYCALTGTWPGPSGSIVPAAPRENDAFLSPRQVRAGVPKPLDLLWREFDCTQDHQGRRRRIGSDHPDVSTAQGIAAELLSFVGDPAGMPDALAQSIPPINELRPVWLPSVEDPLPHDSSRDDLPVVPAATMPDWADEKTLERDEIEEKVDPPIPLASEVLEVSELPTEAGIPLFGGDDDDDVQWLRTRSTPPAPPPPFEDPPERPLFATDPADGSAVRRQRPDVVPLRGPHPGDPGEDGVRPHGYWPWDTGGVNAPDAEDTSEDEAVPGRNWLRLAMAVGLAVLLLVAVAIAFNLGRGRTALGGDPDTEPSESVSTEATQAPVISGITPTDFDPLGDNGENPDSLANLFDGDNATTWNTQTYNDQLGPPLGLKTGVGLVLDLGRKRDIRSVDIRLAQGSGTVQLYSFETPPIAAPSGRPVASATGSGRLTLAPEGEGASAAKLAGRYLVLWWTALPEVAGDFRAEISEVVVRGE